MATVTALPLFHLYGDPPDDQAFDFIHVETIASRSSVHDWLSARIAIAICFQILLIERGGGEMTYEATSLPSPHRAAILVPPTMAHGFRFRPEVTDGWVMSFTEDVAEALGERSGEALKRLQRARHGAYHSARRRGRDHAAVGLCARPARGRLSGARGFPPGDARTARADRGRGGAACGEPRAHRRGHACAPADATVEALAPPGRGAFPHRAPAQLLRRTARHDGRPAERSRQARDRRHRRSSDPPARAHRGQARSSCSPPSRSTTVADDLAFADPSHFARFFRKQTGITPHEFRDRPGRLIRAATLRHLAQFLQHRFGFAKGVVALPGTPQ